MAKDPSDLLVANLATSTIGTKDVSRSWGRLLVMAIDPRMLDAAVRVTSAGDLAGTGFFVTVPSETLDGVRHGYVVTADHVVRNQIEIAVEAPDPFDPGQLYDPVPVEEWRRPVPRADVAIAPWNPGGTRHPAFPYELMIPNTIVRSMVLGSHIHYIGIFEPLMRPVVRSGTIAALDQGGVPHGATTSRCISSIVVLIVASAARRVSWSSASRSSSQSHLRGCVGRDSGGDVVRGESPPPLGGLATFTLVCGMFARHYSDGESAGGVVSRYGVGVMVPSQDIKDALMADSERDYRALRDREIAGD